MIPLDEVRVQQLRSEFPALARRQDDRPVLYLDGPAGTQVPMSVANAVSQTMLHHNANRNGMFATSREADEIIWQAQTACADWFNCSDPDEIVFGPNMTTLTFHLSRAIALQWQAGDEILLTHLDHDANFTPWFRAAQDRGVKVQVARICPDDATLDEEDFLSKLNSRTRLVALTCASNSSGSKTNIRFLTQKAHEAGAQVFLDAVHFAPHQRIDIVDWQCDFAICSAYKFFGPHIGVLWGRKELLEKIEPYKVRPAPNSVPAKWMTGTQNHACLAGVTAAIDYVSTVVTQPDDRSRRERLDSSLEAIVDYERKLVSYLIERLLQIPSVHVFGITQRERMQHRVPTVILTVDGLPSKEVARRLGDQGIYTWHGNYYAIHLSEQLNREPDGMLRVGLMHYNTRDEIDRLVDVLQQPTLSMP